MNKEIKHEKCKRCKCHRLPEEFLNNKGRKLKTCVKCRELVKKSREKNKCEHGRQKYTCKECGGGSICEHGRQKSFCKECGGASICEHGKRKSRCKECGGSSICEHGKQKHQCKKCGGSSICEHGKRKSYCKECGGSSYCEHGKLKYYCKECGGASICEHGKRKSRCKECGGSAYCEHGKQKYYCKECGGASICEHGKRKDQCKECDPLGHLKHIISSAVTKALKANKSKRSIKYLDTTIEEYKKYLESKFKTGMTWENYGEWHIDHIQPIRYKEGGKAPDLEEVIKRLHYTNTQPLWATENISKGNRFIG